MAKGHKTQFSNYLVFICFGFFLAVFGVVVVFVVLFCFVLFLFLFFFQDMDKRSHMNESLTFVMETLTEFATII